MIEERPVRDDYELVGEFAARLENASPTEILEWAVERYHPRLAVVSNFGPSTVVVIHHLAQIAKDVPILHLNTGFAFKETLAVGEQIAEKYGVAVQELRPELTVEQQAETFGPELFRTDPDLCCYMRKVEPLEKALIGRYDAWATGVRKSQSSTRAAVRVVEWDAKHDMMKVNPLASWTSQQCWEFIKAHGIPYNALHDQGYPSVGCWPCTRPVKDGEDERAGRWAGSNKTECGIHLQHFTAGKPANEG